MNKKLICVIISSISLMLIIFLICFYNIPRIDYDYDKKMDIYYVDKAYGNAKKYTILDEKNGKKVLYIDEKAFMDKTRLEFITLGENITKIERLAFSNCKNLKDIDLSNVITVERNAFMDCKSLESINLASCIDVLGGAFIDCESLENVSFGNINSIGTYAFTGTSISEIELPKSLELLGINAFYGCNELKKIKCYSKDLKDDEYLLSLGSIVEFIW